MERIGDDELYDAILRSGYLLEQRVCALLDRRGYYTDASAAFTDEHTGKSREYDIRAQRGSVMLAFECENNLQPIVFFLGDTDESDHVEDIKFAGEPSVLYPHGDEHPVPWFYHFELESFHHYTTRRVAVQYCSFQGKEKSGSVSWTALHNDEQHNSFVSLVQAVDSIIEAHNHEATFGYTPRLCLVYPVLVLQGELLTAAWRNSELIIRRASRVQYRKHYFSASRRASYRIDVVQESALPQFLSTVEKEGRRLDEYMAHDRELVDYSRSIIEAQRPR